MGRTSKQSILVISILSISIVTGVVSFQNFSTPSDYVIDDSVEDFTFGLVQLSSATDENGSNDGDFYTAPSFGLSPDPSAQRVVDQPTTLNGQEVLVAGYHTEWDKQIIQVGDSNTLVTTFKAENGPRILEFYYGIPGVGQASSAEGSIEIHFNFLGEIEEVRVNDNNNLLNGIPTVTVEKTGFDTYTITLQFGFGNIPIGQVFALEVTDQLFWTVINYFNDGFEVEGDPLVEVTDSFFSNTRDGDFIQVTQIDRKNNLWSTEDGIIYTQNEFGTWQKVTKESLELNCQDTWNVMTRINCNFDKLVDYEQMRAQKVFDSSSIQGELAEPFAYSMPVMDKRTKLLYNIGEIDYDSLEERLLKKGLTLEQVKNLLD